MNPQDPKKRMITHWLNPKAFSRASMQVTALYQRFSSGEDRRRWRTFLLALFFILSVVPAHPSLRREYGAFQSVCAVVQIEASSRLAGRLAKDDVENDLAKAISDYFRSHGLTYPVERGTSCFPRNVSKMSKQLSLVFHVTVTDELSQATIAGATIAHSTFAEGFNAPHDYPTKLFSCATGEDLKACVRSKLHEYFTQIFVPLIEMGESQLRGKK